MARISRVAVASAPGLQHGRAALMVVPGGQSLTGRLWDVLFMLRVACGKAKDSDRLHFAVMVDEHANGRPKVVTLWALVGPATPTARAHDHAGGGGINH